MRLLCKIALLILTMSASKLTFAQTSVSAPVAAPVPAPAPTLAQVAVAKLRNTQLTTICTDHGFDKDVCANLLNEFDQSRIKKTLADPAVPRDSLISTLDEPMLMTSSAVNDMKNRASVMVMGTDLQTALQPLAQAALQQVLLGAAVTQVGSQPSTSGATNLVSKPTTTDLISIASESGAFTDTTNGSSITIQANALGLAKAISNSPVFQRVNTSTADLVQPLNFSIALNTVQAGTAPIATTGTATKSTPSLASIFIPSNNASFSSFTASYTLHRRFNPQSKDFRARWQKEFTEHSATIKTFGDTIAKDINTFQPIAEQPAFLASMAPARAKWHNAAAAAEAQGDIGFESFVIAYVPYWDATMIALLPDETSAKNLLALSKDIDAYSAATYAMLNDARGTLANFSYTYTDDGQKPATHDFTASVGYVFKGNKPKNIAADNPAISAAQGDAAKAVAKKAAKADADAVSATNIAAGKRTFMTGVQVTANVTGSIYAHLPADATYQRFRAFQGSAEIDKPFGGTVAAPFAIFSVAGYGQYQFDPTVLTITSGNLAPGTNITLPSDAQVLLGTSGWLGVVQGKLVVNLSKGLSLPIAIKWSNKTDLLQANDIRGQFGLSYDLSALKSLITGSK